MPRVRPKMTQPPRSGLRLAHLSCSLAPGSIARTASSSSTPKPPLSQGTGTAALTPSTGINAVVRRAHGVARCRRSSVGGYDELGAGGGVAKLTNTVGGHGLTLVRQDQQGPLTRVQPAPART